MHGTGVGDEVESRPRVASKELGRQQVSLEAIASRAGEDDVPRHVSAAMRQRMHVIERGELELERSSAIHAASAAVPHRGSFDRPLLRAGGNLFCAPGDSRRAWEGDTVELPASGQCHLAKKATPRRGQMSRGGVSRRSMENGYSGEPSFPAALLIAALDILLDVVRVGSLASGGTRNTLARAPYRCSGRAQRARGQRR